MTTRTPPVQHRSWAKGKAKALILLLALIGLWPVQPAGQKATLTPSPWITFLNNSGQLVNQGCVWTYIAGTTTLTTTWADPQQVTPNANPIILGADSRALIYLAPGNSYKYTFEQPPCNSGSHGAVIRTQDNIQGVPTSSNNTSVLGTAAVTLTANSAVYLSDGSGGRNAGQWYLADSTNNYSSTTVIIGVVQQAISSGNVGTITLEGYVTGFSSLTPGALYYVSTAGAITNTAPANRRVLGQADTATTLVVTPSDANPAASIMNTNDFRLTVQSGSCVPVTDVTGASAQTIYLTPCTGNRIALLDSSGNPSVANSAEISLAVPASTNTTFDVYAYLSGTALTLETQAWRQSGLAVTGATNASPIVITATAHGLTTGDECSLAGVQGNTAANGIFTITTVDGNTFNLNSSTGNGAYTSNTGWVQCRNNSVKPIKTNGLYVKNGDNTRRYVGAVRTTGVANQTEDSAAKRYVWNAYNRVLRTLLVTDATASWNYTTATWRQARAQAANQIEILTGLPEDAIAVGVNPAALNAMPAWANAGIGEDGATLPVPTAQTATLLAGSANQTIPLPAVSLVRSPVVPGRHFYTWMEASQAAGTTTWYGTNNTVGGNTQTTQLTGLWRN